MDINISSDHPIWNLLPESLVRALMLEIPTMNGGKPTPALMELLAILNQHPKAPELGSTGCDTSETQQPISGLTSGQERRVLRSSSANSLVITGHDQTAQATATVTANEQEQNAVTADDQGQNTELDASKKPRNPARKPRPRPSTGGCCRNGKKVGLGGQTSCGGQGGGNKMDSKKRKRGDEEEEEDEEDDMMEKETERDDGEETSTGETGTGHDQGGVKDKSQRHKRYRGTKDQTEANWYIDGVPPNLDAGASILFTQLASSSTLSGHSLLATLVSDIVSNNSIEATSQSYDLSFASILVECSKIGLTKATRDFRSIMLYVRLAIHIDE